MDYVREVLDWRVVMTVAGETKICTSSVSPELLQGFACCLALVTFLWNIALLSKNTKAAWRASFFKSPEQADQCKNSGETEEVFFNLTSLLRFAFILIQLQTCTC